MMEGVADVDSPKKPKKKAKKTHKPKPSASQEAQYAPGSEDSPSVTKITVKPGREPAAPASPMVHMPALGRTDTGTVRRLSVAPEGGYATGFYRVLLETKRVEMLCRSLTLHYRHVALLHRLFLSQDDYNTGEITIDEFFHAIKDEKRPLTMGIFPYVGLDKKIKRLKFDDFVLCIVTFSALSRKELLHYAFTLFDKDESGIMDMKELRDFCGNLRNKDGFFFQKNVDVAQKKLAERDHTAPGAHRHVAGADGLVDFEDLQEGSEHFQVAFYPLLQFQRKIQSAALGEAFWSDVVYKKAQIERIVHYMRLHNGHLPRVPIGERIGAVLKYTAFILTGGGTTTVFNGGMIALRNAAITKYAEEMRIHQEQEEAAKKAKEEEKERRRLEAEAAEAAPAPVAQAEAGATHVEPFTPPHDTSTDGSEGSKPHKKTKKTKKGAKKTHVAVE